MVSMRALVMVLLVACVGGGEQLQPDAPDAGVHDLRADLFDDGFGFPCNPVYDGAIGTECTTRSGMVGWCLVGACRRSCDGGGSCPAGQLRIPLAGGHCACAPDRCYGLEPGHGVVWCQHDMHRE